MYIYSFEKLDVWQKAQTLTTQIYKLTLEFPSIEQFGLTSQMRRCAISITSNIAEGSARKTPKDQGQFSTISYGSLMELLSQLITAKNLNYISIETLNEIRPIIDEISNKLNALRNSQYNRTVN